MERPGFRSEGEKCITTNHGPRSKLTNTAERHDCGGKSKIAEYGTFLLLATSATIISICLHIQQWLGFPLYWLKRSWSTSWQAHVKESVGLLLFGLNQWLAPVTAHISGDISVEGQIGRTSKGRFVCQFPKRMILVANHQLYTDWLFLWWTAYTAGYHGHLIIVLKDAIGKIPIVGWGMRFFCWIFLSRRWETDRKSLEKSINGLSDPSKETPMWLLIFPEGTNLSKRSMGLSRKWAEKSGLSPFELTLLPKTRGLQVCIEGLRHSVDWLYDCTIAYEDIPSGVDGQDVFNLKSLYIQGRKAPTTHIHWRRCAIDQIPFDDPQAFERWLYNWWAEKEQLLQHFKANGRFPTSGECFQTEIKLFRAYEALQVLTSLFAVVGAYWAVGSLYRKKSSL